MKNWKVEFKEPAIREALLAIAEKAGWNASHCAKYHPDAKWLATTDYSGSQLQGFSCVHDDIPTIPIDEAVKRLADGPPKPEPAPKLIGTLDLGGPVGIVSVVGYPDGSLKVGCKTIPTDKVRMIREGLDSFNDAKGE